MKMIFVTICLIAIGIAIPHGKVAAQQLDNLGHQLSTTTILENARRQWDQQHQGQNLVLSVHIVNANTFEAIVSMELVAHGVTDLDEARWSIRRQLGFLEASDVRTVGGVPQRILWGGAHRIGEVQSPPPCHCPWQHQQEFTHTPEVQQMPGVQQILPRWR